MYIYTHIKELSLKRPADPCVSPVSTVGFSMEGRDKSVRSKGKLSKKPGIVRCVGVRLRS